MNIHLRKFQLALGVILTFVLLFGFLILIIEFLRARKIHKALKDIDPIFIKSYYDEDSLRRYQSSTVIVREITDKYHQHAVEQNQNMPVGHRPQDTHQNKDQEHNTVSEPNTQPEQPSVGDLYRAYYAQQIREKNEQQKPESQTESLNIFEDDGDVFLFEALHKNNSYALIFSCGLILV